MSKIKKPFLKIFFKIIFLVINMIAALALFFSFASQFIPPSFSLLIAYCGLAFPYIVVVNACFVIFWVFLNYKYTLISLILILININNIDRYIQLKDMPKPEKCAKCIKVMSYNAKLFGLYNYSDKKRQNEEKNQIFNFLRKEKPDILCVQEYFLDKKGDLDFHTTDSLLSILGLEDSKKCYYQYLPISSKKKYYYGLAIFSRYKIVNADFVTTDDSTSNKAIFVDIKYKGDTIRIYNLHLASIRMNENDYTTGKELINNGINDPKLGLKAKLLSSKISDAFIKREVQVKAISKHIDSCCYPIVVCGDFNDSPVSYAYHKIGNGFKDAFRESGKGYGTTYFGDSFPEYRIDFIFHDKKYNSFGFTTCTQLKVSDHYPVYSYISLLK